MTTIDEYFGTYLKTEDIPTKQTLTIREVKPELVGGENEKEKLVVYFKEIEKGLTLNKVNAEAIAEIAESRLIEGWNGVRVCLYVDKNVMFGGKRVGGIRVEKPTEADA
jgi:hypothetical protein